MERDQRWQRPGRRKLMVTSCPTTNDMRARTNSFDVIAALWAGTPVRHEGEYYRVEE